MRRLAPLASVMTLAICGAFAAEKPGRAAADEDAVFAAVLQQQIKDWPDTIVCLGIDPGRAPQSPDKDFMARFQAERRIRTLTECESRPKGAIDGVTRRPAVIVTAGPIDWIAADEAHVALTYFRSSLHSGLRTYRVVKERTGWTSLGPILTDGPF